MSPEKSFSFLSHTIVILAVILVAECSNNTNLIETDVLPANGAPSIVDFLSKLRNSDVIPDFIGRLKEWYYSTVESFTGKPTGVVSSTISRLFHTRTFGGHRKRMQFALLPIMYKMGVMTTLLGFLTVLTLKGLTIGVILLIFAFGGIFTKFAHHSPWKDPHHNPQPIHVHLHSLDQHPKTSSYYYSPDSHGWDRIAEASGPTAAYPSYVPPTVRWDFNQMQTMPKIWNQGR